jgi:hypothetical protein
LAQSLVKAQEARDILRADRLIDHIRKLRERTESLYAAAEDILNQAKRAKDLRTALFAIREAANVTREGRANAALLGELTGEFQRNVPPFSPVQLVIAGPSKPYEPVEPFPRRDIPGAVVIDLAPDRSRY